MKIFVNDIVSWNVVCLQSVLVPEQLVMYTIIPLGANDTDKRRSQDQLLRVIN